jgi:MFS family permease
LGGGAQGLIFAARATRATEGAMTAVSPASKPSAWRTPLVILLCGCAVSALSFGPRSTLGLFLAPMTQAQGWGRDVFSLALALQMLLWGAGQPIAGAVADRYGAARVIGAGALLYCVGLLLMAFGGNSPFLFYISAGVLVGFGLSGAGFQVVLGAFAKLMPAEWRSLAFGVGTAAGSFGQFLFAPLAILLLREVDWQLALLGFAILVALMVPISAALQTPTMEASAATDVETQSLRQSLAEALGERSYVLLVMGFFTCGFQLLFITVHLPPYLIDRGLTAADGAWTLAAIGLFNIAGSLLAGWLGDKMPKRYLLSFIYFARSVAIVAFITLPASLPSAIAFGAAMGLLWLSTVPPTNGIIAVLFGTRWLTMLAGLAFFSHQVGGFLGVFLGGFLYERTGSYDLVWWGAVALGVISALLNLPIVEKPVSRRVAAAPA